MGLETLQRKENEIRKDTSKGYNEYKEFEGKKYTGMRVGGVHHWYYERGEGARIFTRLNQSVQWLYPLLKFSHLQRYRIYRLTFLILGTKVRYIPKCMGSKII
jgi:hypothetical protein